MFAAADIKSIAADLGNARFDGDGTVARIRDPSGSFDAWLPCREKIKAVPPGACFFPEPRATFEQVAAITADTAKTWRRRLLKASKANYSAYHPNGANYHPEWGIGAWATNGAVAVSLPGSFLWNAEVPIHLPPAALRIAALAGGTTYIGVSPRRPMRFCLTGNGIDVIYESAMSVPKPVDLLAARPYAMAAAEMTAEDWRAACDEQKQPVPGYDPEVSARLVFIHIGINRLLIGKRAVKARSTMSKRKTCAFDINRIVEALSVFPRKAVLRASFYDFGVGTDDQRTAMSFTGAGLTSYVMNMRLANRFGPQGSDD